MSTTTIPPGSVDTEQVAPAAPPVRPEASPVPVARPGVRENRNFAHAHCETCHWRGPGRRARSVAEHDGHLHALTGCGI